MKTRKILFTAVLMAAAMSISGCGGSGGSSTADQDALAEKIKERMEHLSQSEMDGENSTDEVLIKETAKNAGEAEGSGEDESGMEGNSGSENEISRINYYDFEGNLIYYESYAYYDNGLLCSTTLHSVEYYDNGEGAQESYVGNDYTFLYLYDADGNVTDTLLGSLTIADNYDETTGRMILGYEYDADGNSGELVIYPKEESIEQEKFHVDASRTEKIYGEAPVIPTRAENGWASSYLNEIFTGDAPTDMTKARFMDVNDDGQPELWMDYGYGYAGGEVFATDGSTTDKVYLSHGAAYTIRGSNLLYTAGGHMGGYYDTVYQLENGKFVTVAEGSYGETEDMQRDENDEPVYEYYWNGNQVEKDQYEQNLKNVFDKEKAEDNNQNIYTFEQCRALLQKMAGV